MSGNDPELTSAWSKFRSAAVSCHIELCYPFADGGIGRNRVVLSHPPRASEMRLPSPQPVMGFCSESIQAGHDIVSLL